MNGFKNVFITAVTLSFSSLLYAQTPAAPATVDNTALVSPDKPNIVVTAARPSFTLKLKSNPTTGFSWFLRDENTDFILVQKHSFQKPDSKLAGAPGFELWTFKLKPTAFIVPRQLTLRLVYTRPWENDNVTQDVFTISTIENSKTQ
jgi:inhibitor of cysteine peptidase